MLKICEKLFFRSSVRNIVGAIIMIGGLGYHLWIFLRPNVMDAIDIYGYVEYYLFQVDTFVYFFLFMLFLSYDYLSEPREAGQLDVVAVSGTVWKSDLSQIIVLMQWVFGYAIMVYGFALLGFSLGGTLTGAVAVYFLKLVFLYVVLNGIVTILISLLLAKTVNKLLGYICIVLFGCAVSPLASTELGYLSMVTSDLHDMFKVFLIMPEGLHDWKPGTLLPVNLPLTARSLFWLILAVMGLMAVSRKKRKVLVTCILGILLIGDIFCMNMKTSFFCGDDSNSETDSNTYDQIYYMIDQKGEEIVSDQTFTVLSYKMNLRLKQIMYADVTLELEKNAFNTYPMTLYHQYEVDTVTDGDGNTLEYERKGDYLTVFGGEGKNICITYHGGLSNCYSNRQAMFLPGWFAYYPIPGYHTIIEEYQYIENWQEEKVEYDITVDTDVSVFSNLPRVEENHFRGNTKGATLISGFVAEAELDNGIRCIYPYLDKWDDPVKDVEDTSININQSEDRQRVLDILEKNWTEDSEKVIIIYPVNLMNADITWTEDTLMGKLSWHDLYSRYQENHTFLDVAEPTDPVETIQWVYDVSLTDEENPMTYDELREFWDRVNRENGVSNTTDEEFEEAVRENLGEEAYRQIMSTKGQDEGGEE